MSEPEDEWTCPKPGCDLDVDGHSFALAIEHIYETEPDEARRVVEAVERKLLS